MGQIFVRLEIREDDDISDTSFQRMWIDSEDMSREFGNIIHQFLNAGHFCRPSLLLAQIIADHEEPACGIELEKNNALKAAAHDLIQYWHDYDVKKDK